MLFDRQRQRCLPDARRPTRSIRNTARPARIWESAPIPGDEWQRGGGAAWGWYAYDPELHMVYYATGNPGLWSPQYRCAEPITQENCNSGKFDNKWSMSIFARNVDTGEAEWVYQMTPFDQWDYDGINEVVLVDIECRRQDAQVSGALRPQRLRLCARPHRRHAAARQQVRHGELGREDRHEDRPPGEGGRALAAQGRRQHPGVPVGDGRQGSAAGGGGSERCREFLCADQQLVHGRRAAGIARTPSRERCTCSPMCTCIRRSRA